LGRTTRKRRDAILILEHLDEVGLPYHRARLATVLDQAQKSKATKLFEEIIEIGATNLLDQTLIIRNTYRIAAEKGIIPPGV
jgi:3-methyladenine DNA glycosylase AlkC